MIRTLIVLVLAVTCTAASQNNTAAQQQLCSEPEQKQRLKKADLSGRRRTLSGRYTARVEFVPSESGALACISRRADLLLPTSPIPAHKSAGGGARATWTEVLNLHTVGAGGAYPRRNPVANVARFFGDVVAGFFSAGGSQQEADSHADSQA